MSDVVKSGKYKTIPGAVGKSYNLLYKITVFLLFVKRKTVLCFVMQKCCVITALLCSGPVLLRKQQLRQSAKHP